MLIIENIVEDPIKVKYEDESITHNPQVLVDLLKMTTQYVDSLRVENFNFIINPFLIDVANKLKVDEKKFYTTLYEEFKFQNWIKLLKHLKYLFIWRLKISDFNYQLEGQFFQAKGSDVEYNFLFNFCNYLILVFLCKIFYFRFRAFISFFLCAFNAFQVKFGYCYGQVSIRSYYRIYFLVCQVLWSP